MRIALENSTGMGKRQTQFLRGPACNIAAAQRHSFFSSGFVPTIGLISRTQILRNRTGLP
jgi:hypothetical protein